MKYKDVLIESMANLAKDEKRIFLGYNVAYGSKAYSTLVGVPKEKCLETPLAENLMLDLGIGLAIEGYKPVIFFERHDFLFNALDAIVNHLDKIAKLSYGQFNSLPVIIRAVVGSKKPLYPGLQHMQDYTQALKNMVKMPVVDLLSVNDVINAYRDIGNLKSPILLVERKDLYNLTLE